jgi:mRNA-degrading endonuclease RelE of RelBE toxin-antitoxin system
MKSIVVLPSFERSLKKLSLLERKQIAESLESFNRMLITGDCPAGLGFKKINHDKYELRATIRIRVVMKSDGDTYYLVLVGNHDDVRRYLREYR